MSFTFLTAYLKSKVLSFEIICHIFLSWFHFLCTKTCNAKSKVFQLYLSFKINSFWVNLHALKLVSSAFIHVVTTKTLHTVSLIEMCTEFLN